MKRAIWKKGTQKLVVLVDIGGKVHQVDLSKEQMESLLFILHQLFSDGIIKVIEDELPITIPNYKESKTSKWYQHTKKQ